MTNEELLQDLKQFISTAVRAEVTTAVGESEERLRSELSQVRNDLRGEIIQAQKQTGDLVAQAVDDLGALIEADKEETKQRVDEHNERLHRSRPPHSAP